MVVLSCLFFLFFLFFFNGVHGHSRPTESRRRRWSRRRGLSFLPSPAGLLAGLLAGSLAGWLACGRRSSVGSGRVAGWVRRVRLAPCSGGGLGVDPDRRPRSRGVLQASASSSREAPRLTGKGRRLRRRRRTRTSTRTLSRPRTSTRTRGARLASRSQGGGGAGAQTTRGGAST